MESPTDLAELQRAIDIAGGQTALAERIGVKASLVAMWLHRESVPAKYCPSIERATGIRCERIRKDVEWGVLRKPGKAKADDPFYPVKRLLGRRSTDKPTAKE